jgi:hypothetical protein
LHVRPGRLAMLQCRFNKTRHQPKRRKEEAVVVVVEEEEEQSTQEVEGEFMHTKLQQVRPIISVAPEAEIGRRHGKERYDGCGEA